VFVDGRQEEGVATLSDSLTELFNGNRNM
jgi:hypothetical protein